MPLLPIPVGIDSPATCHEWSILDHLLSDEPRPYVIDPNLKDVEVRLDREMLVVSFPNLASIAIDKRAFFTVLPAFGTNIGRTDAMTICAADGGRWENYSAVAAAMVNAACTSLLFVYANMRSDWPNDLATNFLFHGDPRRFVKHLLKSQPAGSNPKRGK